MIERFDAVLATDVCGNKDVVMRQRNDGLFVRYEDHLADNKALLDALKLVQVTHPNCQKDYYLGNDTRIDNRCSLCVQIDAASEHSEPQ